MFFALKGENFNGNQFAADAIQKGARYAVVDDQHYANDSRCLLVEDTLQTLQQLANWHRRQLKTRVLAITGSNGKTTTKEIVYRVLSKKYACLATQKNLNNHIGVPLTLLQLTPHHQFAVVEMGANHPGEIAMLCKLAEPDYGIITNIGKAHLEGFGSFEGVIRAKSELYDFVCHHGGVIFYNADNKLLTRLLKERNCRHTVAYANTHDAYCSGKILENTPYLKIQVDDASFETHLMGDYNFENLLAGICVGKYMNVDPTSIYEAIKNYIPSDNRSQVIQKGSNEIILDAYNANPTSMKAALENFRRLDRPHKALILGDMFELGSYSDDEHRNIINILIDSKFEKVFLIGEMFYRQAQDQLHAFRSPEEFIRWISHHPLDHHSILIKGSRGMALEKIIDYLQA
jgi:UDP-N-acetylmuramoyl-tripeptide--D-alanyl-D-alanine ligase